MKLAFIVDPLDHIKTYKDSTFAMMEEAARRNHRLFVLYQEHVLCRDGIVHGIAAELRLTGQEGWYESGEGQRCRCRSSTQC